MFNTDNEPISKSNMKKLIKLMLDAKKAKEEYETFKAEITKDLKDGKYVIENIGSVSVYPVINPLSFVSSLVLVGMVFPVQSRIPVPSW